MTRRAMLGISAGAALLRSPYSCPAAAHPVFAPRFVGRPPSDALMGLCRLPDGELRHYNYGLQADPAHRLDGDQSEDNPFYIASADSGLTWERRRLPKGTLAADERSPISGEYIRLMNRGADGIAVARSRAGIDGSYDVKKIWPQSGGWMRPAVFVHRGRKILVGCRFPEKGKPGFRTGAFFSNDDGITWNLSNLVAAPPHVAGGIHQSVRWQNGGMEPTFLELNDGRIWMLMRTSQDTHYESFSLDGGETWDEPRPSRFYATITMPTLGRLSDGRILLLWNNTTPLPEVARDEHDDSARRSGVLEGYQEDVFTNRDAIHAAISADEGRTWRGFRELYLDPRRAARDYGDTGGSDRGLHQNQFVQVEGGAVLASVGQHWLHRSLLLFHPDWLLEKRRANAFENGLEDWCVHMYIKGIRGHCAYNREPGAGLIPHPRVSGRKVLQIRRQKNIALVSENQGAIWNFPACRAGVFTARVMFVPGGQGGRISLLDRWVNPSDVFSDRYSMFNLLVRGDGAGAGSTKLTPGKWHGIRLEWDDLSDPGRNHGRTYIDGTLQPEPLALNHSSVNGIGYVHLLSVAERTDDRGFLVESVSAEAK